MSDSLVLQGKKAERALSARIAELERKLASLHRQVHAAPADTLTFGDLVVDRGTRSVVAAGRPLALHRREYAVLVALMEAGGAPVPHRRLQEEIWGAPLREGANDLAVHIYRLRRQLDGSTVRIKIRYGFGYLLAERVADGTSSP